MFYWSYFVILKILLTQNILAFKRRSGKGKGAVYILAFERRASGNGKGAVAIPLALMVSHDTRAGIETLLRENEYFGLKPEQVTLLLQEKVACFADADGRLAMRDRYTLVTKPHAKREA
ncbi:hypothetical protein T492DRAFT_1144796 [Pavlovales sp. CCMP2436]|nr:hypothetical protein T492DRAFT_1144796 [Pavlovales sp. CCMP2436]